MPNASGLSHAALLFSESLRSRANDLAFDSKICFSANAYSCTLFSLTN